MNNFGFKCPVLSIEYSENESKSLKEIVSKREEILKGILYVSATESIAKVSRYRYECIPTHKKQKTKNKKQGKPKEDLRLLFKRYPI